MEVILYILLGVILGMGFFLILDQRPGITKAQRKV